ncbi:MAG: hypothetical protein HFG39_04815 [Lachnospiraceae bacterium]|nr:hypothetical protein [Lachnospiraceae bacterium]
MGVKLPPIEKIHEAYSAIADKRVVLKENEAEVSSSDLTKTYMVKWKDEVYSSNDNASYWQGYVGYPIIAVLMLQGKLPLNQEIAMYFQGINWKKINTEYKNKFSEAVSQIMGGLKEKGIDCNKIEEEIQKVYQEIGRLTIQTKRSSIRPPK